MATLYEIDAAILGCCDEETGEILDEENLNALLLEKSKKLEGVALWIKNLESDAAAIKAEENALKKRREAAERKAQSLRNWLQEALDGQLLETARVHISYRKSTVTEVDAERIPKKWCIKKITYTPDKATIKNALLAGQKIKGAFLSEHQNLQIR